MMPGAQDIWEMVITADKFLAKGGNYYGHQIFRQ
jgi:hypothetical protein